MVLNTLREMAKGGMNDQLGGGFHRYSVDARWFVPHFEKMLYDQAQLAVSYLEGLSDHARRPLRRGARDILDYVIRDMTRPGGRLLFGRGCRQRHRSGANRRRRAKAHSTSGRRPRSRRSSDSRAPGGSAVPVRG